MGPRTGQSGTPADIGILCYAVADAGAGGARVRNHSADSQPVPQPLE